MIMLQWVSNLGLRIRKKLHGERIALINWTYLSGPFFTGKAKRLGQAPGEMFLLERSGETVLLNPTVAPSSSVPRDTKPPQTRQMVWSGCFEGYLFPHRLHTASTFPAPLFSAVCVGYYFTGCLSHSAFKVAPYDVIYINCSIWLLFFQQPGITITLVCVL